MKIKSASLKFCYELTQNGESTLQARLSVHQLAQSLRGALMDKHRDKVWLVALQEHREQKQYCGLFVGYALTHFDGL
jgi:hypothetical protein